MGGVVIATKVYFYFLERYAEFHFLSFNISLHSLRKIFSIKRIKSL